MVVRVEARAARKKDEAIKSTVPQKAIARNQWIDSESSTDDRESVDEADKTADEAIQEATRRRKETSMNNYKNRVRKKPSKVILAVKKFHLMKALHHAGQKFSKEKRDPTPSAEEEEAEKDKGSRNFFNNSPIPWKRTHKGKFDSTIKKEKTAADEVHAHAIDMEFEGDTKLYHKKTMSWKNIHKMRSLSFPLRAASNGKTDSSPNFDAHKSEEEEAGAVDQPPSACPASTKSKNSSMMTNDSEIVGGRSQVQSLHSKMSQKVDLSSTTQMESVISKLCESPHVHDVAADPVDESFNEQLSNAENSQRDDLSMEPSTCIESQALKRFEMASQHGIDSSEEKAIHSTTKKKQFQLDEMSTTSKQSVASKTSEAKTPSATASYGSSEGPRVDQNDFQGTAKKANLRRITATNSSVSKGSETSNNFVEATAEVNVSADDASYKSKMSQSQATSVSSKKVRASRNCDGNGEGYRFAKDTAFEYPKESIRGDLSMTSKKSKRSETPQSVEYASKVSSKATDSADFLEADDTLLNSSRRQSYREDSPTCPINVSTSSPRQSSREESPIDSTMAKRDQLLNRSRSETPSYSVPPTSSSESHSIMTEERTDESTEEDDSFYAKSKHKIITKASVRTKETRAEKVLKTCTSTRPKRSAGSVRKVSRADSHKSILVSLADTMMEACTSFSNYIGEHSKHLQLYDQVDPRLLTQPGWERQQSHNWRF